MSFNALNYNKIQMKIPLGVRYMCMSSNKSGLFRDKLSEC